MPPQNATQAFFRYLTTRLYLVRTPCWAQSCRTASRSLNAITRQSSSSTRWKSRQGRDSFAREAKVQGLKSRAAFKLLEIDAKYKIFRRGQTVVDLGYAPGSWSQVAVERTKPSGRIVGIDIIPAQPPKGVSTIQGNFLSTEVQNEVKRFMRDADGGRPSMSISYNGEGEEIRDEDEEGAREENFRGRGGRKEVPVRVVDVVLSDMDEPWPQTTGFYKRSLSDPYYRMMNTTGINFKDHAGSMV
ncbi:FtsJ-like methyltransferase-domain-containing protein, partial [Calycina marina]